MESSTFHLPGLTPPSTALGCLQIRSPSIPRDIQARRRKGEFNIEDAEILVAKLQALDKALAAAPLPVFDYSWDLHPLAPASDGLTLNVLAEKMMAHIKKHKVRRPEGIPASFIDAYKAALAGRIYVNKLETVNWAKGRECTCSEALQHLLEIDEMLETSLRERFDAVNDRGTHSYLIWPLL